MKIHVIRAKYICLGHDTKQTRVSAPSAELLKGFVEGETARGGQEAAGGGSGPQTGVEAKERKDMEKDARRKGTEINQEKRKSIFCWLL